MRVEKIGDCTLYLGDCRDILPSLSGFDSIVSDPVYGNSFDCTKKRNYNSSIMSAGVSELSDRRWKQCPGNDAPLDPSHMLGYKNIILWGANNFSSKLPDSPAWFVWDKKCGTGSDNFSDCELAYTNLPGTVRMFPHLWRGICRAGAENVTNGPKLHIFQKPIALMRWCISQLPKGITGICDPYMGSCTTGAACIPFGIPFIGIDVDPESFEISCVRIEKAWRFRPTMFESNKPEQKNLF
jgi:DNA modification methylase